MKIGKVLARLEANPKVAKLTINSDNEMGRVELNKDFYAPGYDNFQFHVFTTAKQADEFIRKAVKVPEGMKVVRNAMTGKSVLEAEGTPYACSVASEAYWCN